MSTFKDKQLNKILAEYEKISNLLTYEEVVLDVKLYRKLEQEKKMLEPIVDTYETWFSANEHKKDLEELLKPSNINEKHSILNELDNTNGIINTSITKLQHLLVQYKAVFQSIIIEIASPKSSKSNELAYSIEKGYTSFCKLNNIEHTISEDKNSIFLEIEGLNVKELFKNEIGIHKDVESQRICHLYVYTPFTDRYNFNENDIQISSCHASGAGGQHVNTTDSAIRVVHIPTGISATHQSERSQIQNKQKAIENLKLKLERHFEKQNSDFISSQKKKAFDLIKRNLISKIYYPQEDKIVTSDKQTISFKDFLEGKKI